MNIVNNYSITAQGVKSLTGIANSSCPSIIIDPADTLNGFPVTMTIDYGTTGCYDSIDHKIRKGEIVCVFSNVWHVVGSSVKVYLNNYSDDGVSFSADTINIAHLDSIRTTNSAQYAFSFQVFNAVASTSKYTMKWNCARTITQTSGSNTPLNINDDVFSLTGNATGVNRNALAYKAVITTNVVKSTSCSWIGSGKIDLTPEGYAIRKIDYGSGTCDNTATLTINGSTYIFTMN
jgi:hypothetical protein